MSYFTNAQVELQVDTTHIRIGEQISYTISTPNEGNINFPKLQLDSLGKVEVVHSLPVDTLKNRLYKKYILTSFDSGSYHIPRQEVVVNNQRYLIDSLLLNVGTVSVDTTKQKLFPIKSIYKSQPKTWRDYLYYIWWLLSILLVVTLIWWLTFRFRKISKKKKRIVLSPIEEALSLFQSLDKKQLIEQQKIKDYYVELTEIVRDYIGKDVHIPTLEVTTDELITLLSIHNKSNKIGIDKERITQLHQFLKQADLVKFAKAKPELLQIQDDRKTAETIINDIQSLVHKPILDEFGNEVIVESAEEIKQKTNRKRRTIGLVIGALLFLMAIVGTSWYYGFQRVKDTIMGHPTKELLEGDWYHSSYGYPAIGLESPKILKSFNPSIPQEAKQTIISNTLFGYGSLLNGFYIIVGTTEFIEQVPLEINQAVEGAIQSIQSQQGVSNVEYETEDISISGVDGQKIIGTLEITGQKMNFIQFVFINEQAVQQLNVIWRTNDLYAEKIVDRFSESIQLQKMKSDDDEDI